MNTYKPTDSEAALIQMVGEAYEQGVENLNKPIAAFSDRSVLQTYDLSQSILNVYKPEIEKTIEHAWKTDTRRPITRNKMVSVIAHEIHNMIIPSIKAQTTDEEYDEYAAGVMRDLLDYARNMMRYNKHMVYILLDAMAAPVTIVETGYAIEWKDEKYRDEEGNIITKQVIDDVLSGFFMSRVGLDEFLIPNTRIENLQEQDWVIRRKMRSEDSVKSQYMNSPNIRFVRGGTYYKKDSEGQFFGYAKDKRVRGKEDVEEVTIYNRKKDIHAVLLNGIPVTEENNEIKRLDKRYPFAKVGYEPLVSDHSFYYFPFVMKLKEDQELLEESYNMIFDAQKLDMFKPMAYNREIQGSIVPGARVVVDDKFEAKPLLEGGVGRGSMESLYKLEGNFEESSPTSRAGVATPGEKTREEVRLLDGNANVMQAIFRSQYREFVIDLTDLMISDIQQYVTLDALEQIVHKGKKFKSIVMPKSIVGEELKDKEIKFINPLSAHKDSKKRALKILGLQKKNKMQIAEVNPLLFLDMKFNAYTTPDQVESKSKAETDARVENTYLILRDDPHVKRSELVRKVLTSVFPYEADNLIRSEEEIQQMQQAQQQQQSPGPQRLGGADNQPVDPQAGFPVN